MIYFEENIKRHKNHTGATTDITAPTIAPTVTMVTKTNIK